MSISRTVSEIFIVKEWHDLETGGRGRSRLLKMTPFNGSYTTFYWFPIVSIALCCTIFELLVINNRDLEIWVEVTECHSNWYHSKAWVRFPIRLPCKYGRIFNRL